MIIYGDFIEERFQLGSLYLLGNIGCSELL